MAHGYLGVWSHAGGGGGGDDNSFGSDDVGMMTMTMISMFGRPAPIWSPGCLFTGVW